MNQQFFEFPPVPAWPFSTATKLVRSNKTLSFTKNNSRHTNDVGIVHIYNPDCAKGGMTIAYQKSTDHKSGMMVDVAVQVCSDMDSFSKKTGTAGARAKFDNGETIQLPLLKSYFAKEDIAFAVKESFTALYNAV